LPEVRNRLAVPYFIENGGPPSLRSWQASSRCIHLAILSICVTAWILGSIILGLTSILVPHDIATLRRQMRERAETERAKSAAIQASVIENMARQPGE
jgi:hypothetical protein